MEVSTHPAPDKMPEKMMVSETPIFWAIWLPKKPPMQKQHMVRVKLRAICEASQPNWAANGVLRMDQA